MEESDGQEEFVQWDQRASSLPASLRLLSGQFLELAKGRLFPPCPQTLTHSGCIFGTIKE
jgi:hypothetical protein